MPFSKYISLIQLICAIVSILLITSLVIGVTRVGFYGAAAMAFSICKNREFYFAISGEPIMQFPVKLVYNKHVKDDLESARENISQLQSDYDILKVDYEKLKSEYDQYKKDSAAFMELTEAEQQAEIELAKREKDTSDLESQKSKLEKEIAKLESKIDE